MKLTRLLDARPLLGGCAGYLPSILFRLLLAVLLRITSPGLATNDSKVEQSWMQGIEQLRKMLVESGRDDPILSGINRESEKILLSEHTNGHVLSVTPRSDAGGGGGGNGAFDLMRHLTNRSHLVRLPAASSHGNSGGTGSGVVHMQSQKQTEHIGPDGRFKASICDQPNGFLRKQRSLCLRYIQLMESVVRGYFMGLRECEYQFSAHRWNCHGYNLTLREPNRRKSDNTLRPNQAQRKESKRMRTYMDRLLSSGTRESAYVLAITSAGISHAVTKACSSGMHDSCGCDRTIYDHERQPNFEWSGCSDNIHFGAAFSRKFLDAREKGRVRRNPKLGLTNLHNNHVGRQAVVNRMDIKCKCHGVSGSCEMRTCWRALPDFRSVGTQLRERFQEATFVDYINNRLVPKSAIYRLSSLSMGGAYPRAHGDPNPMSAVNSLPMPTENELIYSTRSPSYCDNDPRYGSIGTSGRRCSEDSKGPDNCASLCCGRQFRREVYLQEEKCHCKFHWCCEVRCQICRKTVVIATCN
nr:unnamed protein product [Spirometra erinaceieuropaei]